MLVRGCVCALVCVALALSSSAQHLDDRSLLVVDKLSPAQPPSLYTVIFMVSFSAYNGVDNCSKGFTQQAQVQQK